MHAAGFKKIGRNSGKMNSGMTREYILSHVSGAATVFTL